MEAPAAKTLMRALAVTLIVASSPWVWAQTAPTFLVSAAADVKTTDLGVNEWLARIHESSRRRAYAGTFVISSGAALSSARIWYACEGDKQVERVESLTGAPRSTFRHNEQVLTFLSESRVVVQERRESLAFFRNLLQAGDSSIAQFYSLKSSGSGRVAGLDADVLVLQPKDSLRFGYRVWTEKKTGLVVKLQILGGEGQVLEQAAFTELLLDAPVSVAGLTAMMANTAGYQVEKLGMVKAIAAGEGWALKESVPGFKPMNCYKRALGAAGRLRQQNTLQWIFSDGLASVSLFIDAFDATRHLRPGVFALGATHTLTRRVGDWWLTAVGEVPPQTLLTFAQGLERSK